MAKNKGKQRTAANTAESATLSVNERILQECFKLYADEEKGVVIFQGVGIKLEQFASTSSSFIFTLSAMS